ncbi:formylglycine-generating enzyme family protein [Catellatospora vulcania]|uniref:formylglycine-generating enzyme family protein n=1 Tax=Catellatospora vulcania TaxID=1460450 RepID=UPI001E45F079|nr:SUMF1/EgtB/PvdO family nonheme iron enzyme [Catellatospora vulcania]
MLRNTTPSEALVGDLIHIHAGQVELRDEGTRRTWWADVAPFRLAAHPVTQELYAALRGWLPHSEANPTGGPQARVPVVDVSWLDAVRFCNELSAATGRAPCYSLGDDPDGQDVTWDRRADGYRLPTEAEWEYACRAGTAGERYGDLDTTAWHRANSGGAAREVATRQPNGWGLHDMIGNVWEWCWDVYDPRVYGPYRVFRGGGWQDLPRGLRASCRRRSHPAFHIDDLGFRVARSP